MSNLRDEFAKAALTGIMANSFADEGYPPTSHALQEIQIAALAYGYADAMLKVRAASCDCSRTNINGVTPCADTLNDSEHESTCRTFTGGATYPEAKT